MGGMYSWSYSNRDCTTLLAVLEPALTAVYDATIRVGRAQAARRLHYGTEASATRVKPVSAP